MIRDLFVYLAGLIIFKQEALARGWTLRDWVIGLTSPPWSTTGLTIYSGLFLGAGISTELLFRYSIIGDLK